MDNAKYWNLIAQRYAEIRILVHISCGFLTTRSLSVTHPCHSTITHIGQIAIVRFVSCMAPHRTTTHAEHAQCVRI